LLNKPEYWAKVLESDNFRPVLLRPGQASDRTIAFLDRLKSAKIDMGDARFCGGSRSATPTVHG
jgi:hypothetical protein